MSTEEDLGKDMHSIRYNQKTTPCIKKWREKLRETQLAVLRACDKYRPSSNPGQDGAFSVVC